MIHIQNLSHFFIPNHYLFNNLNYQFIPTQKYLIFGENGSGKTTLLKIIAGMQYPITGQILINNTLNKQQKNILTFIPTSTQGLFQRLTIKENIAYFQQILKISPPQVTKQLQLWNSLEPFQAAMNIPFMECSTGMKKMALFFILTLHNPQVLLIDEFFSGLSSNSKHFFFHLLQNIYQDKTILLTSHHDISTSLPSFSKLYLQGGQLVNQAAT